MPQPLIWFSFKFTNSTSFTDPDDLCLERDVVGEGVIGKAVLVDTNGTWRVYFTSPLPNADYTVFTQVWQSVIDDLIVQEMTQAPTILRGTDSIQLELSPMTAPDATVTVLIFSK